MTVSQSRIRMLIGFSQRLRQRDSDGALGPTCTQRRCNESTGHKPRPVRPSKTYRPNPVQSAQSTALQRRIGPGTKTSSLKDAVVGDDFLDQSGNHREPVVIMGRFLLVTSSCLVG